MNDSDLIKMISDGFESAKAGNAVKVYNHVAPFHDNGSMPVKSHYPFGWIIYYALHQSHDGNIDIRKRMLARYLKLQVKVPHKLHSMILTEAIHLYKDSKDAVYNNKSDKSVRFSIVNFFKLWNQDNLRPGDWNRKSFDDKPLSSTVEKLLTLCVDELEETRILPSPDFIALIDNAVIRYPDSFNLMSQRAALHILANETAKAAELLRKALLSLPASSTSGANLPQPYHPPTTLICTSQSYTAHSTPPVRSNSKGKYGYPLPRLSRREVLSLSHYGSFNR